jgi:nitrous oxide reductase accessory protein NosL
MRLIRDLLRILLLYLILINSISLAEIVNFKPTQKDKCPVCGMFVYKYKDFLAAIVIKNGEILWFDGAKDLIKFYFRPEKYKKNINRESIDKIFVTDYYSLKFINGKEAFYVIGSNIYGPMGKELIPFERYDDAKEFMKDHDGKKILKFNEINENTILELK